METIKNLFTAAILISMLAACSNNNDTQNVTTSPAPTASATDRSDMGNNMDNASNDAGNAVKDTGNAVGNTVEGVTDAVGDAVTPGNQ